MPGAVMQAQFRCQIAVSDPAILLSGGDEAKPRASGAGMVIDLRHCVPFQNQKRFNGTID